MIDSGKLKQGNGESSFHPSWTDSQCSEAIYSFLSSLNYLSIESVEYSDHNIHPFPIDLYLWVRSSIVLGRYENATRKWEQLTLSQSVSPWILNFLKWQLAVYQRPFSEEANELLKEVETNLPQYDYWQAEYFFIRGFHLSSQDEFRKALRYQRTALDLYGKLGLFTCQAHVLFNLCVIYDHLNEPTLLEITFQQLEKLHRESKCEATLLPLMRIRAYRRVDREEFAEALEDCMTIMPLCRSQGRTRDLGGMLALSLYILIKLEDIEQLNRFLNDMRPELSHLIEEHQIIIHELLALEQTGLVSGLDGRRLFQRWKRMGIKSVFILFLLNLVMDRLLRGRDYSGLVKIARLGSEYSLKKEQALCLVDFRYYEILGLIRSGQSDAAATLLMMYSDDAARDHSEPKMRKLDELNREMGLALDRANWLTGSSFSSSLILSLSARSVYFKGKKIDLATKPIVQKLLFVLIRKQAPIPLGDLFMDLYGMEYNPLRHDRRLHSLIDRTRRLLADASALIREDGQLSVNPALLPRVESLPTSELGTLTKRRGQILKAIHEQARAVTISELEKMFPCSRRTLQFDLKSLVQANFIRTTGGTRSRTYFVEKK